MSKGEIIRNSDRRLKLLVVIQALWAGMLLVLAVWWGTLLLHKSDEIAALQTQLGVPESTIQSRLDKTERMVIGESGTFILLILIANGVLVFFFIRDSRRSRSIQAFFASLTHEFRTPLTSIKLQAEALKDIEDNPKHTPFLDRLLEDVERLDGQVQKTLELARMEGGGTLRKEGLPLKSYLQSRVLPYYATAQKKITLIIEMGDEVVMADPTAVTIIFRNLMDNAIKYSSSFPAKVVVRSGMINGELRVNVIHENSIPHAEPKFLGKLFYRGSNSQGAGVGLYLIKTLMEKMSGTASFQSLKDGDLGEFITELCFKLDGDSRRAN
jgi:signal transduction histidine kinase